MDVRAAGFHTHGADNGEARVAHNLVFLVRERLDWCDGNTIAGVHAHGIKVFDGANDHAVVGLVAHDLHLVFLPANERFLDEDFVHRRKIDTFFGQLLVLIAVVSNATAGAAEGVGGPDDEGEFSDAIGDGPGIVHVVGDTTHGHVQADLEH